MSIEAMKQALEALERIAEVHGEWTNGMWAANKALSAIPTLRTAIEQAEKQEPVGCEGAIVNGRVYADRLEHDYKFECEAGPLHLCTDWVEFRRCFEWLAEHTTPPAAPVQKEN